MRNANAVHYKEEGHEMDWQGARVIDKEDRWRERRIKESIYIKSKETFNLDCGFILNDVWNPLIGHLV